jgi:phosphate/sulfate permease
MDELLVGLAALLSFLFGWNNSSFLIGNLRGSGSLSFSVAVLTAIVGLLIGALLEGSKMAGSLAGSIAPSTTVSAMVATLAVSVVLTLGLTLIDLPVSFSMIMVSAFIGATYRLALPLNASHSELVIAFWFIAPVATAAITATVYLSVGRLVTNAGILTVDALNRTGALVSGLAVSYTLGANNLGLIYGSTLAGQPVAFGLVLALVAFASVGVVTFGRNALGGNIGDKMLALSPQGVLAAFISSSIVVWFGTQFALPVSISQCLLGGMLGAAYSRAVSSVNNRLVAETLATWVVAPMVAFAAAYVITGFA